MDQLEGVAVPGWFLVRVAGVGRRRGVVHRSNMGTFEVRAKSVLVDVSHIGRVGHLESVVLLVLWWVECGLCAGRRVVVRHGVVAFRVVRRRRLAIRGEVEMSDDRSGPRVVSLDVLRQRGLRVGPDHQHVTEVLVGCRTLRQKLWRPQETEVSSRATGGKPESRSTHVLKQFLSGHL